jgi:serine/threonine protein kinase/tetratricopeptide (TPR) repeat protein
MARLSRGLCLGCLLSSLLDENEQSSAAGDLGTLLEAVPASPTLWRLGNYEVLEEIGRGGMGVIYRARQRHSRRIVALKRISSHQAESRETLVRFRREAEAASTLDHPNILPIYEVGETEEGIPYFSMKYASGGSLAEVGPALRNNPQEVVRLLAKVARAVAHAHGQGILHRDLKPGNILLDARGEPLVSDFGLAKWLDTSTDLTRTLMIFGTPGYVAPEQATSSNAELTPAADVYSLGVILFDLFTGRPPFLGENALAVIQQATQKPAPKLRSLAPGLDRDLETICAKCLARDPSARYQSAGALADDLERWLEGRPILARPVLPPVRTWRWLKRNPALATATIAASIFAATAFLLVLTHKAPPLHQAKSSIAVLPFENLSGDDNTSLTQGIQDEILTSLAAISDLRVINRTSVMRYAAGAARDAAAIGRALGVTHLLEGTVQRDHGVVRVKTQLIDSRTGAHLWTHTYQGQPAEIFIIRTEIAKTIADQLRARVSQSEKAEIERRPTDDETAFALYSQGKTLLVEAISVDADKGTFLHAVQLLDRAVARDRNFFSAYCQLVHANAELYFYNFDHSPKRLALVEAALQNAIRLRPDAGETHLARAEYLYRCYRKYGRARAELTLASQGLPNSSRVYALTGYIDRREGHWEEAARNLERALQLDPENYVVLGQIAATYPYLRRFREEGAALDRVLALNPQDAGVRVSRAFVELELYGNLQPYREAVRFILSQNPESAEEIASEWFQVSWYGRDAAEATRAAAALPSEGAGSNAVRFPRAWYEGLAARLRRDRMSATAAYTRARAEVERQVQERPDYGPPLCVLGLIDAMLGQKEDAIREGRRAVQLLPVEQDSINGSQLIMNLAIIYAATGEKDHALTQIQLLFSRPGDGSYGDLRLNPFWDPLRGDPRFEAIVASLAPKQ